MADWQWYEEEKQGHYSQAQEYYLEEGLFEVLDTSVQQSVDKAMTKAFQPLLEGSLGTQAAAVELPAPAESPEAWPHRALLAQMSANYVDHGYSAPSGKKRADKIKNREPPKESDSEGSSSEEEGHEVKRKKKSRKSIAEDPQVDGSQFFCPRGYRAPTILGLDTVNGSIRVPTTPP